MSVQYRLAQGSVPKSILSCCVLSMDSKMIQKIQKESPLLFSSVTNYFVVNLSVADLLVTTICMPVAVSQAVSLKWIHGEVMCKLSFYLQGNFDSCNNLSFILIARLKLIRIFSTLL